VTVRSFAQALLAGLSLLALRSWTVEAADIPKPVDVDYPGLVALHVDATDVAHRVFRVHETVPVAPGALTLLYPRWLPANHSTTGPIELLAGLEVRTAQGRRLEWQRDHDVTYAFHVDVPEGTTHLELKFEFIAPVSPDQGRVLVTPDLLDVQWEKSLLYPAGFYASRIRVEPSVTLPDGWQIASALEGARQDGATTRFAATTLEHLVDSPLFAGRHVRRIALDANAAAPVVLHAFADNEAELAANAAQVALHQALVRETLALFGNTRHYRHYDFLVAIREPFDSVGIEHHQSSENRFAPGYFTDWTGPTMPIRDLLPHEFVHSWNGKFRRPAELWTPSYEVPMRTSLLWVYEGLTEYWGVVLATRSGLWSNEFARETLAHYAADFDQGRAGRQWRSLQDTTRQPVIFYRGKQSYPSWQLGKDYYTEGLLLWLDVDTRIRELTRGRRSLDDFARAFFGVDNGRIEPLTYTFDDVVRALNDLAPYDWARHLRSLLDGHGPGAPLDGLALAGWRVAYVDEPSASDKTIDNANGNDDFLYSLGLALGKSGNVDEVYWGSIAFEAGIGRDMTVVAVNGRAYSAAVLREAIKAAHIGAATPIDLLVRDQDLYRTVRIDYHEGLRYPHLERVASAPDRLAEIFRPRTVKARKKSTE
jgi:predicted metalloprotease with PDZ domain